MEQGQRVLLPDGREGIVLEVDFPADSAVVEIASGVKETHRLSELELPDLRW